MIIEAIKIASINNKRNCRYIQGILNSWINKGYKIVTDIQNEQEQHKEKKKKECDKFIRRKLGEEDGKRNVYRDNGTYNDNRANIIG